MSNVNYMWQDFNIKTFPSETIVFKDGVFCKDLSTIELIDINKKYDLPVHIIYIGEINGDNKLDINISVPEQNVFLTVKIKNKKPAFLNILVKNTGKKSEFIGHVLVQNQSELTINNSLVHETANNMVLETRVVAHKNSKTILEGSSVIKKTDTVCKSDIKYSVMADQSAIIKTTPAQYITSQNGQGSHSASIYRGTSPQIEYLHEAGMSAPEIKKVLIEAFENGFL